jgi:hypothetical protein
LTQVNTKINGGAPAVPAGIPAELVALVLGGAPTDDERAMYRSELRALSAAVTAGAAKSGDRATKAHLEAVKDQIARILDPKFATATGGGGGAVVRALTEDELRFLLPPDGCWVDYVVRP